MSSGSTKILAWDPDFTKLTAQEESELDDAIKEAASGEIYAHDEIDRDNLDSIIQ